MDNKIIENLEEQNISGGTARGYRGGYCPYTEDRNCRNGAVGNFDPNNEECKECGWRAW